MTPSPTSLWTVRRVGTTAPLSTPIRAATADDAIRALRHTVPGAYDHTPLVAELVTPKRRPKIAFTKVRPKRRGA